MEAAAVEEGATLEDVQNHIAYEWRKDEVTGDLVGRPAIVGAAHSAKLVALRAAAGAEDNDAEEGGEMGENDVEEGGEMGQAHEEESVLSPETQEKMGTDLLLCITDTT